jgi:GNAT superfamily N-acetyltransferase
LTVQAIKTPLERIQLLRRLFLQEHNCQIRYNAVHERGWSDSYLLLINNVEVGYGSVNAQDIRGTRETIFEYYLVPHVRNHASLLFRELILTSGVTLIESQSNVPLLTTMLHEFSENICAPVVLFEDHQVTDYTMPGIIFRMLGEEEKIYNQDPGKYVLELNGEVIANGGFLLHYNMPFADLFMDVKEEYRRRGYGSYLLQEVKKQCYLAGRIPAARCNVSNPASKATLLKAGLKVAGHMLIGHIKKDLLIFNHDHR